MTFVKICGITRLEDALLAADLGARAVGFVFWPGSPRFIDPFRARAIAALLPASVAPVGVFVNQSLEYVEGVAGLVRLGAIQLHGDESPEYYRRVTRPIVKSVPVGPSFGAAAVDSLPNHVTILLDAHDPERRGGTGRRIDWPAARAVAACRRTILSGGLSAENIAEAIAAVLPFGVDVSSGVESSPGRKDPRRLRAFFEALARTVEASA